MPIRFPMMHIAESVMNRIFNAADEIDAREPQQNSGKIDRSAQAAAQPMAPDPSLQGAMLDQQLTAPAPTMPPAEPLPEPAPEAVAGSIARGGTAMSGFLGGGYKPLM